MRGIDFLFYSRASGAEPDHSLTEEHWAYMDPFAERMTARGPSLTADRDTWTGSLHIVDLPDDRAAREFVEREPYNRAGMFSGHVVARFENLLGRTMWEFPGEPTEPRFLVIAHRRVAFTAASAHLPRCAVGAGTGALAGVALALQASGRETVEALLAEGPAGPDEDIDLEIHDWEFGGRR